MLDKEVFRKEMERINVLFPNWKVDITDKKSMEIWYSELKELSDKQFVENVDQYIKNNSYPPTVADILNYEGRVNGDLKFDSYTVV